jgi:hypothetical protein
VHTALADFAGIASSGFVDDALLDDGAVYCEAEGWCCGSSGVLLLFGGCSYDERFEDGVLLSLCVNVSALWSPVHREGFLATYDDAGIPGCDLGVIISGCFKESSVACLLMGRR